MNNKNNILGFVKVRGSEEEEVWEKLRSQPKSIEKWSRSSLNFFVPFDEIEIRIWISLYHWILKIYKIWIGGEWIREVQSLKVNLFCPWERGHGRGERERNNFIGFSGFFLLMGFMLNVFMKVDEKDDEEVE